MTKILLTGATGFVGSAVLNRLRNVPGYRVVSAVRSSAVYAAGNTETVVVGNIDRSTDYSTAIAGVDVVIHIAARAHIMRDEVAEPLEEYRKVNVEGSLNLALQAAE